MADYRDEIYRDLHDHQLTEEEQKNAYSAGRIFDVVLKRYPATSILDVGCGLGTWLKVARQRGIDDVLGLEGAWAKPDAGIAPFVRTTELERPFDLGRRFDLAMSLEVGEHLSAAAAEGFVASIVRHAPVVLFSASVPGQGGHHHVNERFLSYWRQMFEAHGYQPLDVVRGVIWNDPGVLWWLRQNVVMFATQEAIARHAGLREPAATPLSIVHPDLYYARLSQLRELQKMLGKAGLFRVSEKPDGELVIVRLPE